MWNLKNPKGVRVRKMVDFKKLKTHKLPTEVAAEKAAYQERLLQEQKEYYSLLDDAWNSSKLNEWETSFITSLLQRYNSGKVLTRTELSERQEVALQKVEKKIYSIG